MNWFLRLCGIFVLLALSMRPANADHIVGGHMQMTNVNQEPGHYRIKLTYYYDLDRGTQSITPQLLFVIFQKRDNQRIDSLFANASSTNRTSLPRVPVNNTACTGSTQSTNWGIVEYEREVRLDPGKYNDSEGYYVSNQDCCRSNGITNLRYPALPDRAGFTYYLEFPPMSGATSTNSSPAFLPIKADFMCINRPFTFSCAATDPDGNELRYSLTSPLKGNVTAGSNLISNGLIPGPFPETQFATGFSATNPIPGSPAVQLDRTTGLLTLTPTSVGRFTFSVKVEEYRSGQKIGEVRQDYQLVAIDCPPEKPPVPNATIANYPTTAVEGILCNNNSLTLQAEQNASWKYQWQKDGVAIPGATSPTLSVTAVGVYTVVNSFTSNCGQPNTSRSLTVRSFNQPIRLERPAKTALCPGSDALVLKAPELPATYTWYWNETVISGLNSNTQTVSKPGEYYASVKDNTTGCVTQTDAITLTQASSPTATVSSANPSNVLCERDSLRLTAAGGATYQWFYNGAQLPGAVSPTYSAKLAGIYSVTVTDANGCRGSSSPLTITVQTRQKPTLDSIPPLCGSASSVVSLRGSPAGGVFSGPGVSGSSFDPKTAGLGVHRITYAAPATNGCPGDATQRIVRVNQPPTVQLPGRIVTSKQGIVTLEPVVNGTAPFTYSWTPTVWLSNPLQATVTVTFPQNDTTYTIRVKDASGCTGEASVRILLQSRLSIPDAFTPNNDQMNDTWKLPGIESFPQAQITIFSRWGEVVYYSRSGYLIPFDGQYNGVPLPAGMYLYVLKLSPDTEPLRGSLMLAR
ncbi:gliding motility-associated C-terminal domain-containing protein [Spirosoma taeanense]|uniref:Gliding motility-associated C-terminal domain-containing protein n=1 Tax=Spirosoma taeanense TaxID=2735870 RepID=A0A6M5Y5T4_9BACT|nr:gliding motility-associated C-terminal domain-containing protein [Spirosoma taeanense]QJW89219.1 gliding motility-associated C-terminal domain-containing protein [Spirosoma taeanense]